MTRSIKVIALGYGSLTPMVSAGLEALPGHWDVTPIFDPSAQTWEWSITDGPVEKTPETSFFPAFDGDYFSGEGERLERPPGGQWDFLGVEEGDPIWIFPETTTYGSQTEPGFGDTQNDVAFVGNLQVFLAGIDGPDGGDFSLFDNGGTYMATSDGIDSSDVLSKPAFHSHFNWAFTEKGMWRVRLQVMGFLGAGQTNPTPMSTEVPVHFAIGGLARWRASNFQTGVVMSEDIAGSDADPDGDRLQNIVEYALGGDPNSALGSEHGAEVAPQADLDAGRLALSFHRRSSPSADEGITIAVEWADTLAGPWIPGGTEVGTVPVGADWEQVTIRDDAEVAGERRFARVRVTELP